MAIAYIRRIHDFGGRVDEFWHFIKDKITQCACPTLENNHSPQCTLSQLVFEGAAAANQDEYVCTACDEGYDGAKCDM